jgi:predicted DNA-binding protein YlxM (UPF0122 family)
MKSFIVHKQSIHPKIKQLQNEILQQIDMNLLYYVEIKWKNNMGEDIKNQYII